LIPLSFLRSGVSFAVRVIPRAGHAGIAGVRGDALLVRIASAPVDGAANDALIAFLAALLDCPRRDVAIVSGQKSRDKRIVVSGLSVDRVTAKLSAILHE
jgi:uncharacterized protein (TIGR00251 family)